MQTSSSSKVGKVGGQCERSMSCLLGPMNKHLEMHGLMDGTQRGARAG